MIRWGSHWHLALNEEDWVGTRPLHYGQVSGRGGEILCGGFPHDERDEGGCADGEYRDESGRRAEESVKGLLKTL